ncbi:hypothetical protein GCM10027414_00820 [Humibacter ginsengiterrae]
MNEPNSKPLRAPSGLGKAGRALWRQIATDWHENNVAPDAREHRLLEDACREADTLAMLEAEIATAAASGSLVTSGSMGQAVTHPHVSEARRSRAQIAANLKALQLDVPEPKALQSGSQLTISEVARLGGRARWAKAHG